MPYIDVDAQPCQLVGDLHLLLDVEREARRLLPVPQGGVEDVDTVLVGRCHHGLSIVCCTPTGASGGTRRGTAAAWHSSTINQINRRELGLFATIFCVRRHLERITVSSGSLGC